VGHQCFMCIWVIKHGGWNICEHVPKAHPPSKPKKLKHTQHIVSSYVKCCGINHKSWWLASCWCPRTIWWCTTNPKLRLEPNLCLAYHYDTVGTHRERKGPPLAMMLVWTPEFGLSVHKFTYDIEFIGNLKGRHKGGQHHLLVFLFQSCVLIQHRSM